MVSGLAGIERMLVTALQASCKGVAYIKMMFLYMYQILHQNEADSLNKVGLI